MAGQTLAVNVLVFSTASINFVAGNNKALLVVGFFSRMYSRLKLKTLIRSSSKTASNCTDSPAHFLLSMTFFLDRKGVFCAKQLVVSVLCSLYHVIVTKLLMN